MVDSLYKSFDDREQSYQNATVEILSSVGDNMTKAVAFLINNDRKIKWIEIEKFGKVSNIIYAIGIVSWEKGDIIKIDGTLKRVTITGYTRPIRALVTIDGLESKEPVELYKEMVELNTYEDVLTPSDSYKLFNDPDFYGSIDEPKFKTYSDKLHKEKLSNKNVEEFNIDELTTRQKEALFLFDETNIGKLN